MLPASSPHGAELLEHLQTALNAAAEQAAAREERLAKFVPAAPLPLTVGQVRSAAAASVTLTRQVADDLAAKAEAELIEAETLLRQWQLAVANLARQLDRLTASRN